MERIPDRNGATESTQQPLARSLLLALNASVRAIRLYPVENSAVQRALAELNLAAGQILQSDDGCEVRCVGDYVFINETRIRLMMDNYAAVSNVLGLFRGAGIGGIIFHTTPSTQSWIVLLSFLQSPPLEYPVDARLAQYRERLDQAFVREFELTPFSTEQEGDGSIALSDRERARQTYSRTLDVTREVMVSARLGKSRGLKRVKRAVQGIVDAIIADAASMIGLTNLREFDEYTFVHSVNVCILSVALGRRLELSKSQLLELGMSALLHDIGKAAVPLEILNKRGSLTPEEKAIIATHPWRGVLALLSLPVGAGRPWRALAVAFEHHMRTDFSGYPQARRTERLSIFSKIIAVADGFDAATTSRVYQDSPWSPSDVLRGMRDNPRLGLDQVVVKAFINLTGIYPTGTVVVLDTNELAIVMSAHPDPSVVARPIVRLLSDAMGNRLADLPLCDLNTINDLGEYLRTIIRTEDAERQGIRVADYFA